MQKHSSQEKLDEISRNIVAALIEVRPDCIDTSASIPGPNVRLGGELGLKSLDFVRFAGVFQRKIKAGPLNFHKLFVSADGSFASDITIGQLQVFVTEALSGTN